MVRAAKETYRPERRHKNVYDSLYAEYSRLHDLFGRGEGSSMRALRDLQKKAQQ
jgi:L-ribulokinase